MVSMQLIDKTMNVFNCQCCPHHSLNDRHRCLCDLPLEKSFQMSLPAKVIVICP